MCKWDFTVCTYRNRKPQEIKEYGADGEDLNLVSFEPDEKVSSKGGGGRGGGVLEMCALN